MNTKRRPFAFKPFPLSSYVLGGWRGLATACNGNCNRVLRAVRTALRGLTPALNEATGQIRHVGAMNEAISPDQEWFRVTPFGDFPVVVQESGRPRRVIQRVDRAAAEAMVASFNSPTSRTASLFRGLPIFIGHADDPEWRKQNPGIPAEAMGRIKALEVREDGLYGRHVFNERGRVLVSGEGAAYDSQSPHWGMQEVSKGVFRPVDLYSIGLTNHPNIPGNAIGLNEAMAAADQSFVMKTQLIALLAALGRPLSNPSAVTDEQLVAALNEAVPVATQLVTAGNELATIKPQLATVQGQLTTAINESTGLRTEIQMERAARADLLLTSAINEGRITQAQRTEWHGKLTANGADFVAVATQLHATKKAVNTRSAVGDVGGRKSEAGLDGSKITAINEAVQKHIADNRLDPVRDHDAAFAAVRKAKPDLFSNASE